MPLRLEVQTLKHWQGSPRLLQTLLSPGLLPRLLWELLERWESLIIGHGPWPKSFQTRLTSYDSKLFGPVQTSSAAFCWGSKAVRGAGPTNERKTHKVSGPNEPNCYSVTEVKTPKQHLMQPAQCTALSTCYFIYTKSAPCSSFWFHQQFANHCWINAQTHLSSTAPHFCPGGQCPAMGMLPKATSHQSLDGRAKEIVME